jgi:hypothetical protein
LVLVDDPFQGAAVAEASSAMVFQCSLGRISVGFQVLSTQIFRRN